MTRKTKERPNQESFWNEKTNIQFSSKKSFFVKDLLNSIDEAPDFHDPFSELNLFLSQKVKQEMCHCGNSKKWSVKLQDELLYKITPEFQQKFPHYRLGVSALKKTWEKVAFYSQQIQHQKEALTQAGKLNVSFFIKENLKSLPQLKNTCHIHPYHFAHQLALKMSECIATVDGIRPKLDELTQMIWSIQRHLIPNLHPQHFKSPYDEYSKIDKLIVKTILEISAQHPQISQQELAFQVKEALNYLHNLPSLSTIEKHALENSLKEIPCGQKIEDEIATILIDDPYLTLPQAIQEATAFFKKIKELSLHKNASEIDNKIHIWTMQSDMLLRWVHLNHETPLLKLISEKWPEFKTRSVLSYQQFVSEICQSYLDKYAHLSSYIPQVTARIWTCFKYTWYTLFSHPEESSFDRFLKWHGNLLSCNADKEHTLKQLEELCRRMLPLVPFDLPKAQNLFIR